MKKPYKKILFILSSLAASTACLAAEWVDLSHAQNSILQQAVVSVHAGYRQTNQHTDKNGVTHIRMQQTWEGYPVWGADAVVHIPNHKDTVPLTALPTHERRINGTMWIKLESDLTERSASLFSKSASNKVMQVAVALYKQRTGKQLIFSRKHSQSIVYVDQHHKAHWAWKVDFRVKGHNQPPAIPTFIMDAMDYTVYKQWDNLQTVMHAVASGNGGNPHMGKLVYDGVSGHLAPLTIYRDEKSKTCYLRNNEVIIKDRNEYGEDVVSQFMCEKVDEKHNNSFWNGDLNSANGGYSPDNDALFIGHVVQNLYKDWYGISALSEGGKSMKMVMRVHDYEYPANAFWDGEQMTFGDGDSDFYPFTILNIGAHEIGHGFTEQHSNLIYEGQSGGLNESYSDMAGAAANFYAFHKNTWRLGAELSKDSGEAFRYMDFPTKDCRGRIPGHYCSIDRLRQYHDGLSVHFSSGVFNRAFYLLATTEGWDTHKAFDVMVKANQDYWTSSTTFMQAACGVLSAAQDLKYDTDAVKKALIGVELDTTKC